MSTALVWVSEAPAAGPDRFSEPCIICMTSPTVWSEDVRHQGAFEVGVGGWSLNTRPWHRPLGRNGRAARVFTLTYVLVFSFHRGCAARCAVRAGKQHPPDGRQHRTRLQRCVFTGGFHSPGVPTNPLVCVGSRGAHRLPEVNASVCHPHCKIPPFKTCL